MLQIFKNGLPRLYNYIRNTFWKIKIFYYIYAIFYGDAKHVKENVRI
jgi:hypothetical protein